MPKRKAKQKATLMEIVLTAIAFLIGLSLLIGGKWHTALYNANGIHFHFCNHTFCWLFAIIWWIFALVGLYYLFNEKKMPLYWLAVYGIVLVIGIIAMNVYSCEDIANQGGLYGSSGTGTLNGQPIPVDINTPLPGSTCTDTDGGDFPLVKGKIVEVPIWDKCDNDFLLTEYVCLSSQAYGGKQHDCRDILGISACCDGGICTTNGCNDGVPPQPDEIPCGDTYPECGGYCPTGQECNIIYYAFNDGTCQCQDIGGESPNDGNCNDGIDNDGDGYIDCYDPECNCEYSCDNNLAPQCGGTCPYNEYCNPVEMIWGTGCDCLTTPQVTCTETDSGDDPTHPGTTSTLQGMSETDYCFPNGRDLVEYACIGNSPVGKQYHCADVCSLCQCLIYPDKEGGGYCGKP